MRRARDHHARVLQWLAHGVEHVARQLEQFIHEEHAAMCETHLTRPRPRPAADEAGHADGVVRRAERRGAAGHGTRGEHAAYRVNGDHFEQRVVLQRREDAGEAAREHRLSRTRGPDHVDVVIPGCRDLESAFGQRLSDDLAEVRGAVVVAGGHRERRRLRQHAAAEEVHQRGELRARRKPHIPQQRGLGGVRGREHERAGAGVARRTGERQRAANGADGAVQAELAGEQQAVHCFGAELTARHKHADRDRQVERGAVLPHISGREVHRPAAWWEHEAGVDQRRADALARLLHAPGRESDHGPAREPGGGVHLDGDPEGLDAEHGGGADGGEHAVRWAPWAQRPASCRRNRYRSPARISPACRAARR